HLLRRAAIAPGFPAAGKQSSGELLRLLARKLAQCQLSNIERPHLAEQSLQLDEHRPASGFAGSIRADEQYRGWIGRFQELSQEGSRVDVAPLQVVDDDGQRL